MNLNIKNSVLCNNQRVIRMQAQVLIYLYLWSTMLSFCLYLLEAWVSNRQINQKSIKSCYIYALTPVCNTGYTFLMLMYLIAITVRKALDKVSKE